MTAAMPHPALCRIEHEAFVLGAELATKTIKSVRHSREGVTGVSERPAGYHQADSNLLLR